MELKAEIQPVPDQDATFKTRLSCNINGFLVWERQCRLEISFEQLSSAVDELFGAVESKQTEASLSEHVTALNSLLEDCPSLLRSPPLRELFGLPSLDVLKVEVLADEEKFTVRSYFFEKAAMNMVTSLDDLGQLKSWLGLGSCPIGSSREEVQLWLSAVVLGFSGDPRLQKFMETGRVDPTVGVIRLVGAILAKMADSTWELKSTFSNGETCTVKKSLINFLELGQALKVDALLVAHSLQEWMNAVVAAHPTSEVLREFLLTAGKPASSGINADMIKGFSRASTFVGVVSGVAETLGVAADVAKLAKGVSPVFGLLSSILKRCSEVSGAPKRIFDIECRARKLELLFEMAEKAHDDWMCKPEIEELIDDIIREAWKWSQEGWFGHMWDGTAWLDNLNKTFERLESSLTLEVGVVQLSIVKEIREEFREEFKVRKRKFDSIRPLLVADCPPRVELHRFEGDNRFQSITGSGGMGKTVEAFQFVNLASTVKQFPDGIAWIDLVSGQLDGLNERYCEKEFCRRICACLGLHHDSDFSYTRLKEEMAGRPKILVVVDNVLEFCWIEKLLDALTLEEFSNIAVLMTARVDFNSGSFRSSRHRICTHRLPELDPELGRKVLFFHGEQDADIALSEEEETAIQSVLKWSGRSPFMLKNLATKRNGGSWSDLAVEIGELVGDNIVLEQHELLEWSFHKMEKVGLSECLMAFALLLDRFWFSRKLLADMLKVLGVRIDKMEELIACGCLEENGRLHDLWKDFLLKKVGSEEAQQEQRSVLAAKVVLGLESFPPVLAVCEFHWIYDAVAHAAGRGLLKRESVAAAKRFETQYQDAVRSNEGCLRFYFELKFDGVADFAGEFCGESLWSIACTERHASLILELFALPDDSSMEMLHDGFARYCLSSHRRLDCEKEIVKQFVKAGCRLSDCAFESTVGDAQFAVFVKERVAALEKQGKLGNWSKEELVRVLMDPLLPALNLAAYHGNLELVELILEDDDRRGVADPNRYSKALAVVAERDSAVRSCLIRCGASLAYDADIYRVAFSLRLFLICKRANALNNAARVGDTGFMQALLELGADANASAPHGYTVLMTASEKGHVDCARLLLENGADVNAKTENGSTALMAASFYGHVDCARLLLENGADVNAKMEDGLTALKFASLNGHFDCVRLLLENGADAKAQAGDGWTALMWASYNGHPNCARLLLENGADVNAKKENGSTALVIASQNGHVDCARLLLEHRADVDAKEEDGSTALMVAFWKGHVDCAHLLLEHGADPNVCTADCMTALKYATQNDCVLALLEEVQE